MTSGEAEVKVASDGIGKETEHNTHHGESTVQLLSLLIVCFVAVAFGCDGINIHARFFSPHVLLTLIVG